MYKYALCTIWDTLTLEAYYLSEIQILLDVLHFYLLNLATLERD